MKVETFRLRILCFGLLFWFRLGFCLSGAHLGWAGCDFQHSAYVEVIVGYGRFGVEFSAEGFPVTEQQAPPAGFRQTVGSSPPSPSSPRRTHIIQFRNQTPLQLPTAGSGRPKHKLKISNFTCSGIALMFFSKNSLFPWKSNIADVV